MADCNCFTPHYTRRDFLTRTSLGLGAAALAALLDPAAILSREGDGPDLPHCVPRVKRVIYVWAVEYEGGVGRGLIPRRSEYRMLSDPPPYAGHSTA